MPRPSGQLREHAAARGISRIAGSERGTLGVAPHQPSPARIEMYLAPLLTAARWESALEARHDWLNRGDAEYSEKGVKGENVGGDDENVESYDSDATIPYNDMARPSHHSRKGGENA